MAKKGTQDKTYSQLSEELAEIMEWFEGGEANLDQALDKYQQANKLIEQMEAYLKTAVNKINKLKL